MCKRVGKDVKFGTKQVFNHIMYSLKYNINKRQVGFSIFPASREAWCDLLVDKNCNIDVWLQSSLEM